MAAKKGSKKMMIPPELEDIKDTLLKRVEPMQAQALLDACAFNEMPIAEIKAQAQMLAEGTFVAKYVGSVPVAAARLTATMWAMFGEQVIATAGPRIKQLGRKPSNVYITVTSTGIRIVDIDNASVLEEEPLELVEYAAVDASNKKRFGYVSHYSSLGLIYCHMFEATKASPEAVTKCILQHSGPGKITSKITATPERVTGATLGIFEVTFLGMTPCDFQKAKRNGGDCVMKAVSELMSQARPVDKKHKTTSHRVVLVISSEGVRVVTQAGRTLEANIFVSNLCFTTELEGKKQHLLALISHDERLGRHPCHIFCTPPGMARDISDRISEALKQHKAEQEAREGNPFHPEGAAEEALQGILATLELPRKALKAQKALGAGQFGEVYLGQQTLEDGSIVPRAVKMLRGGASPQDKALFIKEAEIQASLKHECVVALVGVCATQRPWLCVLEFVQYGDLKEVLVSCNEKRVTPTVREIVFLSSQLARALAYVASKRFVHLDVAARNCLLGAGSTLKLADFGLTHPYDEGKNCFFMKKTMRLSIRWLAPEVVGPAPKRCSEASDVWAFAIVIWEILTFGAHVPYKDIPLREVCPAVLNGTRLSQPANCSPELFAIMSACWAADPTQRPTFEALLGQLAALPNASAGEIRDLGAAVKGVALTVAVADAAAVAAEESGTDDAPGYVSVRCKDVDELVGYYDVPLI